MRKHTSRIWSRASALWLRLWWDAPRYRQVHRQLAVDLAVDLAVRKRLEMVCLRRKSLLHRQSQGGGGSPAPPLAAPALKARWSVPPWPLRLSPPILSRPSPFTRLNKPTILRNGWKRESRSLDRGCAEGCNAAEPGGSTTEVPATGSVCVRARCALEHEPGQGRMARALASATAFEQMAESGKDAGFALRGELGQHGE